MTSVFTNINIDENDPRFKRLKDTFTEEIKKRFSCEDYEPIVNYVFNYVFESKNSKENSIKEMRELFADKTEEIMDLLWSLTDSVYNPSQKDDLLEEIYKDKSDQNKKFPSQIITPEANKPTPVNPSKPLFSSAIERVRDDKRRDSRGDNYRDNRGGDNYRDNRGGDNYRDNRGGDNYRDNRRNDYGGDRRGDYYDNRRRGGDDRRRGRRDDGHQGNRTMQVGDKKVILKRRSDDKSRSPSPNQEGKRDRSRDDFRDNRDNRDNRDPRDHQEERPYDERYDREMPYDSRNYYGGGYYPMRRFPMGPMRAMAGRGRFAPRGMFMHHPGFMDQRRPAFKKRLMPPRMANQEGEQENKETNPNTSNNLLGNPGNGGNVSQESMGEEGGARMETEHVEPTPRAEGEVAAEKSQDSKKKPRCKKWPQCKNDNCEFSHPKETCPYFPKCVFGDKCLYIHPNITCKFGYQCTRVGCSYSHPAGYHPGMGMMAPMQMGGPRFRNPRMDNNKFRYQSGQGNQGRAMVKTTTEVVEPIETQEAPQQNVETMEQ